MPRTLKRSISATDWANQELISGAKSNPCNEYVPWTERYTPLQESDLVLHRDKLAEFKKLLTDWVYNCPLKCGGQILLLTGPSGCGKTTALKVLVSSFKADGKQVRVNEWIEESSLVEPLSQLEQFVIQAGRYRTLVETNETVNEDFTVLLLKNLPISAADSLNRFHHLLRFHHSRSLPTCLLVLSISTNKSAHEGILPERLLCPISLRNELDVRRLEFNPVAPSLVLKALMRILTSRSDIKHPPRSVVQQLSSECLGDLRTAINQLQFISKSGINTKSNLTNELRDGGLSIFRLLGKILYAKREPVRYATMTNAAIFPLPPHLEHWKRPPLAFDVDDLLDQSQMDGDNLVSWLFGNYLDFTPHMSATRWTADYFSWSDAYLVGGMNWRLGLTAASDYDSYSKSDGAVRAASRHYPALVCCRNLLLAKELHDDNNGASEITSHAPNKKGFHPFKSASVLDSWKKAMDISNVCSTILSNENAQKINLESRASFLLRHRMALLDWFPIALKIPLFCSFWHRFDLETLKNICQMKYNLSETKPVHSATYNRQFKSDGLECDSWLCPEDAVTEGANLPIEEDPSDNENMDPHNQ